MFLLKQGYKHNSVTVFIPGFKNCCQTTVNHLLYLKPLVTVTQYVEQFVECLMSGIRFLVSDVWKMSLPLVWQYTMVPPVYQAKVPAAYFSI